MAKPLTPSEKRRIEVLSEDQKLSTYAISKRVGRSQSAVWNHLQSIGKTRTLKTARNIRKRRNALPAESLERGAQLYKCGRCVSIRSAAKAAGVPRERLATYLGDATRSTSEAVHLAQRRDREQVMRAGRMHMDLIPHMEIGERMGLSDGAVHNYVVAYYRLIGMPYESQHEMRRRIARDLDSEGIKPRQIALEIGVTRGRVYTYLSD